jgi:hypothetical protein
MPRDCPLCGETLDAPEDQPFCDGDVLADHVTDAHDTLTEVL